MVLPKICKNMKVEVKPTLSIKRKSKVRHKRLKRSIKNVLSVTRQHDGTSTSNASQIVNDIMSPDICVKVENVNKLKARRKKNKKKIKKGLCDVTEKVNFNYFNSNSLDDSANKGIVSKTHKSKVNKSLLNMRHLQQAQKITNSISLNTFATKSKSSVVRSFLTPDDEKKYLTLTIAEQQSSAVNAIDGSSRILQNFIAVSDTNKKNNALRGHLPVEAYIFQDKVIVVLKHPCILYFCGVVALQVLFGKIKILGFEIKDDDEDYQTIYSPKGWSLLGLQSCKLKENFNVVSINKKLTFLGVENDLIEDICKKADEIDCVVLLKHSQSEFFTFLNQSVEKLFPTLGASSLPDCDFAKASDILQCELIIPSSMETNSLYIEIPEVIQLYDKLLQKYKNEGSLKVIICGGKSVGKSTLLRYLVNSFLSNGGQVLCIDFDPGQSEFTVPGCLSVVLVDKPLLGPNFTHLQAPERMINIGHIDVSRCPTQYISAARDILTYCNNKEQFQNIPWIVNTMGFNKGLGVPLTVNIISLTKPTDLIQIQSESRALNFPEILNNHFVDNFELSCVVSDPENVRREDSNYEVHILPVARKLHKTDTRNLRPSRGRELMILAYFMKLINPLASTLYSVEPYCIAFSDLILCVSHENIPFTHVLAALNANLVALCSVHPDEALVPSDPTLPRMLRILPICDCVGFGIVRGIDMEAKQLYLITPETDMSKVNCLVLGSVMLPDAIALEKRDISGHLPYATSGGRHPTGKHNRRQFRRIHNAKKAD